MLACETLHGLTNGSPPNAQTIDEICSFNTTPGDNTGNDQFP